MNVRTVQHPVDVAKQAPVAPDRDYGFFYPRWAVLAGILLVPTGIIGAAIKAYYANHACHFGSACHLDATPGALQVLIIWAAFVGLWAIAFGVGRGPLAERVTDHTAGPAHPLTRFFWHLSHFERVTPFVLGFGGVALVGMIIAGARGRLDPAVFALGMVALVVAVVALAWWLRLLNLPYQRPGMALLAAEPETTDDAAPQDAAAFFALAPEGAPSAPPLPSLATSTPNYAAMPNYGDVPPSRYVPDTQPLSGGLTVLPSALPAAPRLDSLEPPPNPNVDMSPYVSPTPTQVTTPLPPSPNADAGGTSMPLPPQVAPLYPDTEVR